jgi:hypothetical protein
MKTAFRSLAILAAGFGLAGSLHAQSTAGTIPGAGLVPVPVASPLTMPLPAECLGQTDGPWTVIAPYGWVYGMKGTIGVGRRTVPVDVSVSDAIEKISDLKGAAELHIESGYGDVGLIADLMYMRLAPSGKLTTVDSRSTFFEMVGMYRLLDSGGRQAGAATFDLLGGVRYYRFKNEIQGNFGVLAAGRTTDWTDLVVGARAGLQVTDDLGVWARADAGGFGIGNSSSHAYNFILGFEYRLCECASLAGGYKWLKIDRENGLGRDRSLIDATLSGPFLALSFRF